MKNKVKLKRFLLQLCLVISVMMLGVAIFNKYEYQVYKNNFDQKLNSIILKIEEDYPDISEAEIIKILNSDSNDKAKLVEKYSLMLDDKSLIKENDQDYTKFLILNTSLITLSMVFLIFLFLKFNAKNDKEINAITKCVEEINKMNYKIDIDDMSEDELSILKNELYKITIKLKEDAENAKKDKLELKDTLADISHQLKTPITSTLIILDNIIDNPEMDKRTREDFIRDIKRELININFLALSLLKLSKLDSNTVHFVNKDVALEDLVDVALQKVEALCDLKNITINKNLMPNIKINCDLIWQVEALSNILKNCVEHSNNNSQIDITTTSNKVYASILIRDYGTGISSKDLPHIFERFYKGEGASQESIGIGLALAKKIIETNNGVISATSSKEGTEFIIKYFY